MRKLLHQLVVLLVVLGFFATSKPVSAKFASDETQPVNPTNHVGGLHSPSKYIGFTASTIGYDDQVNGVNEIILKWDSATQVITQSLPGNKYESAVSPDGRMIAFVNVAPGRTDGDIYLMRFLPDGKPEFKLVQGGPADQRSPSFYNNSQYYFSERETLGKTWIKDSAKGNRLVEGYEPNAFSGTNTFLYNKGLGHEIMYWDGSKGVSTYTYGNHPQMTSDLKLSWVDGEGMKLRFFMAGVGQVLVSNPVLIATLISDIGYSRNGQSAVFIASGNLFYCGNTSGLLIDPGTLIRMTEDQTASNPWLWTPEQANGQVKAVK